MEGAAEGDDRRLGRRARRPALAGYLYGSLVGFGARVAQEHGIHAGAVAELFGQSHGLAGLIVVGNVDESRGLRRYRLGEGGMGVPEAVDADSAREVQVGFPVVGLESRARSAHED